MASVTHCFFPSYIFWLVWCQLIRQCCLLNLISNGYLDICVSFTDHCSALSLCFHYSKWQKKKRWHLAPINYLVRGKFWMNNNYARNREEFNFKGWEIFLKKNIEKFALGTSASLAEFICENYCHRVFSMDNDSHSRSHQLLIKVSVSLY